MLTESQLARWRRTRAKGLTRVVLEQWLVWTVGLGIGGPTLRALLRGGWAGVRAYWTGGAGGVHLALALVFGAAMTYVFGVLSWKRMERLYAESGGSSAARGGA